MSEEKEKNLAQEWEKWRKDIETDIKGIKEAISSQKSHESSSFEDFITSHVPGCPECQTVLEKAGYTKKQEKPKEVKPTPEEKTSKKAPKEEWSPSSVFEESE